MGTPAGAGTAYGQQAATDRLKKAIPSSQPGGPGAAPGGPGGPPPSSPPPGPPPAGPPGGGSAVPGAILQPTTAPNTPVNTPLAPDAVNPVQQAQTPMQARLAVLLAMADSPVEEVAEWARSVVAELAKKKA